MQVVILCGGRGTRLERETEVLPKPMVTIGERPILWHIMKHYAHHGHRDFVLCLGYKGELIKDFFLHYQARQNDVTVQLGGRAEVEVHPAQDGDLGWTVTLADTGLETPTGGRLRRASKYLTGDRFFLTYGDGVCDLDLHALLAFHRAHGKVATVTAVHPPARFGELLLADGGRVHRFAEKPQLGTGQINGGFFVFERRILDYLDDEALEQHPMQALTRDGELMAYAHDGFWQCMDTVRELTILRDLWDCGRAPWKLW